MSDCSPLRLADNSPNQSMDSQNSQDEHPDANVRVEVSRDDIQRHNRRHHRNTNPRNRTQSESSSKSGQLRYGAKNVIELFIPVSICMLIVVGTMKATDSYHYSGQSVIWYAQLMFTDQSLDTGTRVWQSFANAFVMLIFIAFMTTILILLYKFRCYAFIHGWLILSSLMLLFMFSLTYVAEIFRVYNIPMDYFTLLIFIWNYGVVGMICIHWKGPLLLQQGYLITISALMALVFIRCLPDWTIWTVLGIISVWDLVAVLCPRGPLRILVETAQERGEPIFPALIYSSTMMWEVASLLPTISMADNNDNTRQQNKKKSNRSKRSHRTQNVVTQQTSSNRRPSRDLPPGLSSPVKRDQHPVEIHYEDGAQPPEVTFIQPNISGSSEVNDEWRRPSVRAIDTNVSIRERGSNSLPEHDEFATGVSSAEMASNRQRETALAQQVKEERGVKLGLGDFIFFSVLVGKASSYGDWTITMSCYVAILVGLCLTLSLLAIFKKALPALPISIAFGLSSFFLTYVFVVPFAEKLAINQVFI